MSYQLTVNGVFRLADSAFIPQDSANRDWLEYLEWIASGGEASPIDPLLETKIADQGVFAFLKRIV